MLFSSSAVARSCPSPLSDCSRRASSWSILPGRDRDLLAIQIDAQELGVDQRLDRVAIDLLAVLVGRDRIAAEEADDLALGDLVGDVALGDGGDDVIRAGDHGTRPAEAVAAGPAGRAGWACAWARTEAFPTLSPDQHQYHQQSGLDSPSHRSHPPLVETVCVAIRVRRTGPGTRRSPLIDLLRASGRTTFIDYTDFAQSRRATWPIIRGSRRQPDSDPAGGSG